MSGRTLRLRTAVLAAALVVGSVSSLNSASAAEPVDASGGPSAASVRVVFTTGTGDHTVTVYNDGIATIRDGRKVQTRPVPFALRRLLSGPVSQEDQRRIFTALRQAMHRYRPATVNVVFRAGVSIASDVVRVSDASINAFLKSRGSAPDYSTDARINVVLGRLGVDRIERIGRTIPKARLAALSMQASAASVKPLLDISQAYTIHLTNASVEKAVAELFAVPGVTFAEPDWSVGSMDTGAIKVPQRVVNRAQAQSSADSRWDINVTGARADGETLPSNFGIASSEQSFLNAPGVDAVAAYDAIEHRFGQLPGTGETITNVSIGDVCPYGSASEAPTSHQIGGQNYLDVPSMPLIPEYTVDDDGNLSGSAGVCGVDPVLGEILLDFSVMAPLPHSLQRAGEVGSGVTDLLGIAPGAKYRLVVPENTDPTVGSLVATVLAASDQTPRPDVMTMSIGIGFDQYGFPTRYFEQDPIAQSTIALIVNADKIVVCIASGDGLREYTNAAISPSGGSAGLDAVSNASETTNLNDVAFSTVPSRVVDSGAIAVGGSTTDDIFSAPPQDPRNAAFVNQLAFPETRWNGFRSFASAFGSRVDLSAPSDNIPALELEGTGYNVVAAVINGGTSASAPMTAAAAAVALQLGRLTGHPFSNALEVRSFLEKTGTKLPNVPQADTNVAVGPQIDLESMVETLADKNGALQARLPRIAVAQRQSGAYGQSICFGAGSVPGLGSGEIANDDNEFTEATDPTNIVLDDVDYCGVTAANNLNAFITLAPDWENLPKGATYRLYVAGQPRRVLSRDRWTRLLPEHIFKMAGLPLISSSSRNLSLTYEADLGSHRVASVTFPLTFGPTTGVSESVLAPVVPAVVTGKTIPVQYDFSSYPQALRYEPSIVVSYPGRTSVLNGQYLHPLWISPTLNEPKGTVNVPVSALQGDGVYGIAVRMSDERWPEAYLVNPLTGGLWIYWTGRYGDFAMTRVATGSATHPPAPLLSTTAGSSASVGTSPPGHSLEIPFNGSFSVNYDVSAIPHATDAVLEISSGGPTFYGVENPFNNPNGSAIDDNGIDTGSVFHQRLSGTHGTITLTANQAHLVPGMIHVVRILPANGSAIVGESSDVSSIEEDGITAPGGLALTSGYAINPAGTDGVYTSNGDDGSTVEMFSQSTGLAQLIAGEFGGTNFFPPLTLVGGGYVSNDTAVMSTSASATQPANFFSGVPPNLNPPFVGTGWALPFPPYAQVLEMGNNQINQTSAFLATETIGPSESQFFALTANVGTHSSGTPIPLDQNMIGYPQYVAFDYDPNANTGYALFSTIPPSGSEWAQSSLVLASINFTTGNVTYSTLPVYPGAVALDFTLDPNTHVGAFTVAIPDPNALSGGHAVSCVAIIDLTTQKVTRCVHIDTGYADQVLPLIAVDSVNKIFAVQVPFPKADDTDNNPLSSVAVVSESGDIVSESPRVYNLSQAILGNHWFGLNPTTRRGFMAGGWDGGDFYQIVPFSY